MLRFDRLPRDLQRAVLQFIPLWQRLGMTSPPELPSHPWKYYKRMRYKPHFKNIRWNRKQPYIFTYYRQGDTFRWTLFLDYPDYCQDGHIIDYYRIQCEYRSKYFPENELKSIYDAGFYREEEIPSIAKLVRAHVVQCHSFTYPTKPMLKIELKIERVSDLSPPTRQTCADVLCEYMIRLSKNVETTVIGLRKIT